MLLTSLGIPFTTEVEADPRKTPKGKLPFMKFEGTVISDSELIVEFLEQRTQGRVYTGLSPQQRAQGLALTRLIDDHLYWLLVSSRWLEDAWFPNVVEGFFHIAPALVRPLVAGLARRQVRQTLHLHGLGRHSVEDQRGFAQRDLRALNDAVPESGFLFSDTPCVFDFTIAAFMAGVFDNQPATWVTTMALEYKNLQAYTERVQKHVGVFGRFTK